MSCLISNDRHLWVFVVTLSVAAWLRLWGIDYGLPVSYWQDEYLEVMRALQLGTGSFQLDRTGKGGLYLLMFVEYGFYYVALNLAGTIDSAAEFAQIFVSDPSMFYLFGRVTTALLGTLTVFSVYLVGKTAYSAGAGLLAALFMSVNVLHVEMSHMINVDVMMVCFSAFALFFSIRLAEDGARRHYLAAAAWAGVATTAKMPAILLIVPLLIAHAYSVARMGLSFRTWLWNRNLWMGAAVFAILLIGTNPGILLHLNDYIALFSDRAPSMAASPGSEGIAATISERQRPNLYLYYSDAMQRSMGWPLFVLGGCGVAYALWRRSIADVILSTFAVLFIVAIASTTTHLYHARYALPVILVFSVLGGRLLDSAVGNLRGRKGAALAVLALAAVAVPAQESVARTYLLTRTDNRTLAQHWIEENIPHGSRVLIEGARFGPDRTGVALEETKEGLARRIEYWKGRDPRGVAYLQHKLAAAEGIGYDLELVNLQAIQDLQSYREAGIEYFVILPRRLQEHRRTSENTLTFLRELRVAPDVQLLKTFPADPDKRRGPTVEIYKLRRESGTVPELELDHRNPLSRAVHEPTNRLRVQRMAGVTLAELVTSHRAESVADRRARIQRDPSKQIPVEALSTPRIDHSPEAGTSGLETQPEPLLSRPRILAKCDRLPCGRQDASH